MKLIFYSILFCLLSCSHSSKLARDPSSDLTINIVLDIDYTIVSPVEDLESSEVITLDSGEKFRVNNYVKEFMEVMNGYENVNIYFFSGGKKERNLELLSKIKTHSGQSFLDLALDVYSFNDLSQVSESGKFAQKYKKDLKAIGLNLNNTILIDDVPIFSPESQKNNMLWTGEAYYHFEKYSDVISARNNPKFEKKYIPKSPNEWLRSKNIFQNITQLFKDHLNATNDDRNFLEAVQANKNLYLYLSKQNINCLSLPLDFP